MRICAYLARLELSEELLSRWVALDDDARRPFELAAEIEQEHHELAQKRHAAFVERSEKRAAARARRDGESARAGIASEWHATTAIIAAGDGFICAVHCPVFADAVACER